MIASKINPFASPLTKENVRQQTLTSLESLRIPYMDIFYLHAPDHTVPLEETLGAVQQLYEGQSMRSRRVRASNSSHFSSERAYYTFAKRILKAYLSTYRACKICPSFKFLSDGWCVKPMLLLEKAYDHHQQQITTHKHYTKSSCLSKLTSF